MRINFKMVKMFAAVLVTSGLLAGGNAASGAEKIETSENAIIKTVDGVTVIGNDPAKALTGEVSVNNGSGKPKIWIDDRVRFEENSYKTNDGNFNKSAIVNRMRLNLKMNLGKKMTANFSGDRINNFGDNTQNRSEEPVTHGNVVIDLDK
ncbi:MAG TPA: hypothetical protein PKW98_18205 [Candidatus Wallbacteria bacterium]|nr:MAG: hypothetical protein BWY32_01839 [bacterium ADurb.Bin243]HPG59758.1 hypothetical protein [Candidatus Wallbacteria bacterium]